MLLYNAEHDGPDPLNDEDYTIIKEMARGTSKVDMIQLGLLLKKNLNPLLEGLTQLANSQPRFIHLSKKNPRVYEVDLTKFSTGDEFIVQLRNIAHSRKIPPQPRPAKKCRHLELNGLYWMALFYCWAIFWIAYFFATNPLRVIPPISILIFCIPKFTSYSILSN